MCGISSFSKLRSQAFKFLSSFFLPFCIIYLRKRRGRPGEMWQSSPPPPFLVAVSTPAGEYFLVIVATTCIIVRIRSTCQVLVYLPDLEILVFKLEALLIKALSCRICTSHDCTSYMIVSCIVNMTCTNDVHNVVKAQ